MNLKEYDTHFYTSAPHFANSKLHIFVGMLKAWQVTICIIFLGYSMRFISDWFYIPFVLYINIHFS